MNKVSKKTLQQQFRYTGIVIIKLPKYAIPAAALQSSPLPQKTWITFPLTVFLKHGQLDFSKASDSISDCPTLIFGSHSLNAHIYVQLRYNRFEGTGRYEENSLSQIRTSQLAF